jgi:hypothetical protein
MSRNTDLPSLPLFAQALIASRLALRAELSLLPAAPAVALRASQARAAAESGSREATTAATLGTIADLTDDPRVSALQVAILLTADIDQLHFACAEAGLPAHAPLTPHILARLAPCHPLNLTDPPHNPEDDFR